MEFHFKKGVYKLNKQSNFDFQLNRVVMWDGGDLEEIKAVGPKIKTSEDWKRELIALGDKAVSEGRTESAIAYYRMSEFFMYDGDPDKKAYYVRATEMFYAYYKPVFDSGEVVRSEVPYEGVKLPVMIAKAKGEEKDIILLHGGNDSYFEEFFLPMQYLAENGFTTYLFEGPGQGGVMRVQGKHFTHEWERPVKAVLDYFQLDDVTIIGASLGGMLAPRAAAFEERIKRVIAWSIFPNFRDVILSASGPADAGRMKLAKWLLDHNCKGIINAVFGRLAERNEMIRWGLEHGKYAYEADSAFDYAKKMERYQMMDIADRITQDILIAGANRDHFIPYTMIGEEINALKNVRSLTFRLFTDKEDACNHCNCGNVKLTFDTFMDWIMQMKAGGR
ncbi:MAG: alpha/beta hydrolase [Lachnospiraceae bacterium]|nr:alpha/beta hydrolase [Lachnospiraceae bacterium]